MVQQVVGQEALPAAEHVAQEIQPAAAQVPQQAQHGELEVEYVYFCRLGFSSFFLFLYVYKLRTGTRTATLYLSSIFVGCCLAYIGSSIVLSGLGGFLLWVTTCC